MNDIVNIETIPTAIIGNLSRKEIKDKAADMVVGLDYDDIKSYNPESSRKNRILNRVYNRYNKKYNYTEWLGDTSSINGVMSYQSNLFRIVGEEPNILDGDAIQKIGTPGVNNE